MRLTALPPPPPTPMTLMRASPPVVVGGGEELLKGRDENEHWRQKNRKKWHRRSSNSGAISLHASFTSPFHPLCGALSLSMRKKRSRLTVGAERGRAPGRSARGQGLERSARRRRNAGDADITDKGAGAAERGAIAARDDDNDDETAGATRTPAEERREIIVFGTRRTEGRRTEREFEKRDCAGFLLVLRLSLKNKH